MNLANPKLAVFAISFLPQFVAPGAGQGTLLTLASIWVFVDTMWYLLIASLLTKLVGWLQRHRDRLERISGAVLIALGIQLAFES